ncbi:hypothetical protein [Deinococcus roseus]|uniref:hypothetical protein n=1 Tax=Deinococcus roseus TaxID=392414 RepID=UPI0016679DDC|nr:hypothetical protein [Deinococcus roseus]
MIDIRLETDRLFHSRTDTLFIPEYDLNLDNYQSVLIDLCHWIDENMSVKFIFNHEDIVLPVDVRTDLPIFLEQLPSILNWIDEVVNNLINNNEIENKSFTIELYEQGIDSTTQFTINSENIEVLSFFKGKDSRSNMSIHLVDCILTRFLFNFFILISNSHINYLTHSIFDEWINNSSIRNRLLGK